MHLQVVVALRVCCVLGQGEFVSVSRLEAIYQGSSALIHQMYIYGSGLRSYLLAVVVPSKGPPQSPPPPPPSSFLPMLMLAFAKGSQALFILSLSGY